MKVKLNQKTTYFTTQEDEAHRLLEQMNESTNGQIKKHALVLKNHQRYGDYYELSVEEEFTTSKSVLENGY